MNLVKTLHCILAAVATAVFLIAGTSLLSGCPHDGCAIGTTRCSGNMAQICNSNTNWETFMDCDDIHEGEEGWDCAVIEGTEDCTCLPHEEPPKEP